MNKISHVYLQYFKFSLDKSDYIDSLGNIHNMES